DFIELFEQMENEYMRERAADIKDVTKRVLAHLLEKPLPNIGLIQEETIIIAENLSPSETAQINKRHIKGFVTDAGGRTSHSAIMARSLQIPAIVGTKNASECIENDDDIIIDGAAGEIYINPTETMKEQLKQRQKGLESQMKQWARLKNEATVTKDNHRVELAANIGSPQDMRQVIENGAEGIGLYRTEFLYMKGSSPPTEEEQFLAYKSVLESMDEKPVVVRTLDIGGDKQLPYRESPKEMNPFLGVRAIRISLEEVDMFRKQLRALL